MPVPLPTSHFVSFWLTLLAFLRNTYASRSHPARLNARAPDATYYVESVYTTVETDASVSTSTKVWTDTKTELHTMVSLTTIIMAVDNGKATMTSTYRSSIVSTSLLPVVKSSALVTSVSITRAATITTTIPIVQAESIASTGTPTFLPDSAFAFPSVLDSRLPI